MNKQVLEVLEQFEVYLPTKQDKALYKRKSAEMADEIVKLFEGGDKINGSGKDNKPGSKRKPGGAGSTDGAGDGTGNTAGDTEE